MTKFILLDIEGTTSSISFVHEKLFPYSFERMEEFIKKNKEVPEVQKILSELSAEQGCGLSLSAAAELFQTWIKEDKKHGLLKQIQGLIWKGGFESGELKGHVYPEVPQNLKSWKEAGIKLGIYSSGSVEAQKLLFKYSEAGDLTSLLSSHFDTKIGHKREVESYENIVLELGVPAEQVLFLSDITEELDAAKKAGMKVTQLFRDEVPGNPAHPYVKNFDELEV
ncbi:MAG: acireductone synthase [Halobacteriovorax sp.]|nr:acireductone synthase [Halobacteriovorax sp.]